MATMTDSDRKARVSLPSDTEILVTREFEAPRHLVYKAWTSPDLIKRWWGGKRGVVNLAEVDLRVGGKWRYVAKTHRGFEVGFHGVFREIVPNERLVYTEVYEAAPGGDDDPAVVTLTLAETNGRTLFTSLSQVSSKMVRDMIMQSGMEAGLQDVLDMLEEVAVS